MRAARRRRADGLEARGVKRHLVIALLFLLACAPVVQAADPSPQAAAPPQQSWRVAWMSRPAHQSVHRLRFSPDATQIAVATLTPRFERADGRVKTGDNALFLLSAASGEISRRLGTLGDDIVDVAFPSDERLWAVYNKHGGQSAVAFSPRTGARETVVTLVAPVSSSSRSERASEVGAFSLDGRRFAQHLGRVDGESLPPLHLAGQTVIYETGAWRTIATLPLETDIASPPVLFAHDDLLLADSGEARGETDDSQRQSGTEPSTRLTVPFHALGEKARLVGRVDLWGPQLCRALSPDGRWLVAGVLNNSKGSLIAWEVDGGACSQPRSRALDETPRLSRDRVYTALAFARDGSVLAAGMSDGSLRLFDLTSGQMIREVQITQAGARGAAITALAFSVQGQALVAAAEDGRIALVRR